MTITTPNTVVDGKDIKGNVTVAASGVVIKNSRISGTGEYGVLVQSGSATIVDSEISGFANGLAGDNWDANRVDITGILDDGAKLGSNVTLENSWIHHLTPESGAHADGAQLQSGERNVVVRNNVIDVDNSTTGAVGNSALFIAPDLGPSSPGPLTISGNWLSGGNFTVYIVDGNNGQYLLSNISLTDNKFGRNVQYGPLRINVPVTQSGNVWADTGAAVS